MASLQEAPRFQLLLLLAALSTVSAFNSTQQDADKVSSTTTDATTVDEEDSSEAIRQKQLAALRACGWLTLLLYMALSMAVVWRTLLHFLYSSRGAKKAFHVTLLVSTLLQLPEAVEWIWFPTSQSWEAMYVCRLYSLLLLSFCKSYLAICWAGVVSAGQQLARRRITKLVTVLNALLVLWGVLVPILLSRYTDDIYGQYSFMHSSLRGVLTYSGVAVVLVYGILLGYQGFRLRRRLLLARGTVPAASVEKSLNQLMLAIFIFIVADVVRVLALVLNETGTPMSMIVYLILYNIIPSVFPTICMLYLMRRLTGRGGSDVGVSHMKGLRGKRTLSKYMTEEADSDGSSSTGSDSAGRVYNDNAIARAQWEAQQQYLAQQIQSAREAQQSPAFCWVRESMELR
ncbi:RxLR effector protein [Phytophthora megakarya]|uniref:RxLR effector protein n=1 Tax=Phytophthora megakarya TaxID=4795 RepID=A0A225V0P5_9STRA|nr:RxLR effector protein [Phytophthora megakarya]